MIHFRFLLPTQQGKKRDLADIVSNRTGVLSGVQTYARNNLGDLRYIPFLFLTVSLSFLSFVFLNPFRSWTVKSIVLQNQMLFTKNL